MQTEVLVIGGGLAGAAAAIRLAQAGRQVLLVEKEAAAHDKVCGEFLSREAIHFLTMLGLDLPALGAVPISHVRLAGKNSVAEARLPFAALSLSRRVLDEALLDRAAAAGVEIIRGRRVQSLERAGVGWQARLEDEPIQARAVFLATGKHDLRGWKRPAGSQGDLVAFKMHWRLAPSQQAELAGRVELITFDGGYGGLEPVENGLANLCLLMRRRRLEALGGKWEALLAAIVASSRHLDRRLSNAEPLWEKPLAISSIPYGYIRRHADGLWRLGDQAAVIPSLTGDGMSIALHSANLAASAYLSGATADAYQQRLARDVTRQIRLATVISQALVRPWGQGMLSFAAAHVAGLLKATARLTRIPEAAIVT